tara:strand:+ start:313 stop:540 length:228 start_codon:yes stop_codon:yes gene_type:complete
VSVDCKEIARELPAALDSHAEFHDRKFESLLISFDREGNWFLTGFGSKKFVSCKQVARILEEASDLIGAEEGVAH